MVVSIRKMDLWVMIKSVLLSVFIRIIFPEGEAECSFETLITTYQAMRCSPYTATAYHSQLGTFLCVLYTRKWEQDYHAGW